MLSLALLLQDVGKLVRHLLLDIRVLRNVSMHHSESVATKITFLQITSCPSVGTSNFSCRSLYCRSDVAAEISGHDWPCPMAFFASS